MNEQSLEHILMPADMHATETTGLIEVGTWSLEQFPAFAEKSLAAPWRLGTVRDEFEFVASAGKRDSVRRHATCCVAVGWTDPVTVT